jgi:glyoxylase-like metal-dependent hydrolase (beta-lactamase superfamily II)
MSTLQFNEYIKRNVPPYPKAALPVITFADTVTFHFNGDDITVFHTPPSHTDGDSIVYFAKGNVIHMGDVYASTRYPNIDTESGGSLMGFAPAVDLALKRIDDTTKVIPGHGPLSNKKRADGVSQRHEYGRATRRKTFQSRQDDAGDGRCETDARLRRAVEPQHAAHARPVR